MMIRFSFCRLMLSLIALASTAQGTMMDKPMDDDKEEECGCKCDGIKIYDIAIAGNPLGLFELLDSIKTTGCRLADPPKTYDEADYFASKAPPGSKILTNLFKNELEGYKCMASKHHDKKCLMHGWTTVEGCDVDHIAWAHGEPDGNNSTENPPMASVGYIYGQHDKSAAVYDASLSMTFEYALIECCLQYQCYSPTPTPSGDMPTKAPTPCVSAPPASIPYAPNLSELETLPDCGTTGQIEAFRGADLVNGQGVCVRINICHGTSSFVSNPFNAITVARSAGLNGHAAVKHNDGPKNPDYLPGDVNVVLGNGVKGKLDFDCDFTPYCPEPST